MQNSLNRDTGMHEAGKYHPLWKARCLQEVKDMRSARLRMRHEEVFTWEDLYNDMTGRIQGGHRRIHDIPNVNLAGSVTMDAIKFGYIEETGGWKHTVGEQKNSRKAVSYRWKTENQ